MWFMIQGKQIKITIFAKPNAKRSAFLGFSEQGMLVALHAKPHQGAANKELIAFLAELFEIAKSQVVLQKGDASRHKQVILPLTDNVLRKINEFESSKK